MPPTSRTQSMTNVLAATLEERSKGFIDQIEKQLPLLWWLRKKGRYNPAEGESITWSVRYKLRQSEASYQGFDVSGLQDVEQFTTLIASWKQYRVPIIISGLDMNVRNKGPKIFDLYEEKEAAALASLQEQLGEDFYDDGSGNDSKKVTGLDAICPEDTDAGILFGVNRATAGNEWWQSRVVDHGSGAAHASGTLTMRRGMEKLRILCGRGKVGGGANRYPDVAFCTEGYLRNYSDMTSTQQRFTNTMAADQGFNNLTFNGMTIMEDEDCPLDVGDEDQAYFINSRWMSLRYAPAVNFKAVSQEKPLDQDVFVSWILWAGELICLNLNKQGLHHSIAVLT